MEDIEWMEPSDEAKAQDMISWLCEGLSYSDIAEYTGLSVRTLRRMRDGKATKRTWEMLQDLILEQTSMQDYGFMY